MKFYKPGQLVFVEITASGFTLCSKAGQHSTLLTEHHHVQDKRFYISLGHTTGLVTNVILNRLEQPLIYEILFGKDTYSCKAFLADQYLVVLS